MLFLRFFAITFGKGVFDLKPFNWVVDGVNITIHTKSEEMAGGEIYLASASIKYPESPTDDSGCLIVSDGYRKKCEHAFEKLISSKSLSHGTSSKIYTPSNICVAYYAENDYEKEILQKSPGFQAEVDGFVEYSLYPATEIENIVDYMEDRIEGVFLWRNAQNQDSESGKYRDYIRIFENAFELSSKQLSARLVKFIDARMNYTRREVDDWISYRDPISHADKKKSDSIAFDSDVGPFVNRMEQAAYDVIMNKNEWGSKCIARRSLWSPSMYSTGNGKTILDRSHEGKKVTSRQKDRFNAYYISVIGRVREIDENLYPKIVNKKSVIDHKGRFTESACYLDGSFTIVYSDEPLA